MGRKIEEAMLSTIINYARNKGLKKVTAKYIPIQKNKPCGKFFQNSGFKSEDDQLFTWTLDKVYECPKQIKLVN